jgi:hypothetical protein
LSARARSLLFVVHGSRPEESSYQQYGGTACMPIEPVNGP